MISDDDKELWLEFTKGIKKRKCVDSKEDAPKPRIRLPRPQPQAQYQKLDLHGMTQENAYHALVVFITKAQQQGIKRVLIITGKGREVQDDNWWSWESPGVLKREVPKWLNSQPLKSKITHITPASPRDGGDGALYVYLKRG